MVAEKVAIAFVYDSIKGGIRHLVRRVDHQQAISDAADATAGQHGITHDDLYAVFQTELNGDVLADTSTDSEEIVSSLAGALEDRDSDTEDLDYESIVTEFLDQVQQNLMSQGRPEEGVQVLYQYSRETTSISEDIRETIEQLYQHYTDDLEELSRYSFRMAPSEHRYRLSEAISRIERPVEHEIKRTVEEGKSVVLTGQAGTGKSGILAYLYERWQGSRPIYFFDAREFGHLHSRGDLESELGLRQPITDVFKRVGEEAGCCTVLVDQLDNIRAEDAATLFRSLLASLAAIDHITVVCACRRWDLNRDEFEELRRSRHFSLHTVPALDEDKVSDVLIEAGIEEEKQGTEFLSLCQNILNLSLPEVS